MFGHLKQIQYFIWWYHLIFRIIFIFYDFSFRVNIFSFQFDVTTTECYRVWLYWRLRESCLLMGCDDLPVMLMEGEDGSRDGREQ